MKKNLTFYENYSIYLKIGVTSSKMYKIIKGGAEECL